MSTLSIFLRVQRVIYPLSFLESPVPSIVHHVHPLSIPESPVPSTVHHIHPLSIPESPTCPRPPSQCPWDSNVSYTLLVSLRAQHHPSQCPWESNVIYLSILESPTSSLSISLRVQRHLSQYPWESNTISLSIPESPSISQSQGNVSWRCHHQGGTRHSHERTHTTSSLGMCASYPLTIQGLATPSNKKSKACRVVATTQQ